MLKASACDQKTASFELTGYDQLTGWGFVQANTLFSWLDQGYTVTHFDKSALDNDVILGAWAPMQEVQLVRGAYGPSFGLCPKWGVKRRLVYAQFTLPDNWNRTGHNLYAWGYGHSSGKGGWPRVSAGYLYQSSQTIVEGLGGNGLEYGIQIATNRYITVSGYQYEVFDITSQVQPVSQGLYPPTAQLTLSYSVFGLPKLSTRREDDNRDDGTTGISDEQTGEVDAVVVSISPNPANNYLIVGIQSRYVESMEIELLNAKGQSVARETVTSNLDAGRSAAVSISHLPTGAYSCVVSSPSSRTRVPFVVVR